MIKEDPLIQKLLSLELPPEDYAVFGSGPMYAHGIKDLGHDVDIIARGRAWTKVCKISLAQKCRLSEHHVVELEGGKIEIFDEWFPGDWDVDKLIDDADVIEDIRFVRLQTVMEWKELMGREKDFQHIQMIQEYLRKNMLS